MIDYAAIADRVNREFACDHRQARTTYLVNGVGVRLYRRQCCRCGACLAVLRKGELGRAEREAAVAHDKSLGRSWWQRKDERSRQLREEAEAHEAEARSRERGEWDAWYAGYLRTPRWRRKRELVLGRARGICEGCLARPAAHVHHLSYAHVGDELLFELVAVCLECHERIHPGKVLTRAGMPDLVGSL